MKSSLHLVPGRVPKDPRQKKEKRRTREGGGGDDRSIDLAYGATEAKPRWGYLARFQSPIGTHIKGMIHILYY